MEHGRHETTLHFNPTKGKIFLAVVIVLVTYANICAFQKLDLKSPIAKTICDTHINVGISSLQNMHMSKSADTIETIVEQGIDATENQSFVLPFKTRNQSLLYADRSSIQLSNRTAKLVGSGDWSNMAGYFENSLKGNCTKQLVVHGMDFETLKPEQWLNDAVLNFWFKWITVQRTPNDRTSSIHICSTYFLSGVVNEGYNDSYQRWLKNVNIFDKRIILFPVHLAHHWSLVIVVNPKFIRQTKVRWGDERYTRDVTALIHLDPLGSGTVHNKQRLGRAVRDILNKEWDKHCNNTLDQCERPFTHRHNACRLYSPSGKCYTCVCMT